MPRHRTPKQCLSDSWQALGTAHLGRVYKTVYPVAFRRHFHLFIKDKIKREFVSQDNNDYGQIVPSFKVRQKLSSEKKIKAG